MAAVIVIVIVVLIVIVFVVGYNGLVRLRNRIDTAWSQIGVQLERRHDLIPNLIETVKGYAAHEKSTLEARGRGAQRGDPGQGRRTGAAGAGRERAHRRVEESLRARRGVPRPEGEQNFLSLQEELTSTEDRIAYARQFYNDSVMKYNNKIQSIPSNIIAGHVQLQAPRVLQGGRGRDRGAQGRVLIALASRLTR